MPRTSRSILLALLALAGSGSAHAARLEPGDVALVIVQAAREATLRNAPATIAVVDRVGNVLGLMRMPGANGGGGSVQIAANPHGPNTGVNGASVPDAAAAIAKAVTGAYLSSGGNAFSTRTAGQIVQEHFNPGERFQPGGPLYGVQFSQLPCSDLAKRGTAGIGVGPHRSPLGLSADPGGFPLYKGGELVGGVGAIADGSYGIDLDIRTITPDPDELIALAGTLNFEAPVAIRADRITAGGKTLRYSNSETSALVSLAATHIGLAEILAGGTAFVPVTGYYAGTAFLAGQEFNTTASGIRPDRTGQFGSSAAFVLVESDDTPRFPPANGTAVPNPINAGEVAAVLRQAYAIASRARAQIRQPLNSVAQVSIAVVDYDGRILGLVRGGDAPVFGIDVSVQKARTAMLLSRGDAAGILAVTPGAPAYLAASRSFLGDGAFANWMAFSARAVGNLARPYYPDGIDGRPNGPLSRDVVQSTPFSTGLQLDIVLSGLGQHLGYVVSGGASADVTASCASGGNPGGQLFNNGLQIFPGGVPIYRNGQLLAAVGVSGDGVDQDDMIAFLGVAKAGDELRTGVGNAPAHLRADQLAPRGNRLRYVACPFAPFLDTGEQNPCDGR